MLINKKKYNIMPAWHDSLGAILLSGFCTFSIVHAASAGETVSTDDTIEFNTDVLDVKERANIDLSQFSQKGYVMPGKYQMVIQLNKSELPEDTVEFIAPENDPKGSVVCFKPEQVQQFGLNEKIYKSLKWWNKEQCLDLSSLPGVNIRPDLGSGHVYVNIPQAYLEYTAENWDPPARWDDGIPGLLLDYNMNAMSTHQQSDGTSDSLSGNGTTGINIGPWRVRGDWQAQYNKSSTGDSSHNWDWSRYYAYRAIRSLKAKLTVGENYLDSSMFDSFGYRGVSLKTDDNQLPPNLRGYAPEVTGVAKTNAKVTISQQGRVIYETTVAAGPYRIQDLNTAVTGKLDVKVTEQDGTEQNFQVDTSNIPYLTRPGMVRYKLTAGKPSDYDHHSQGPEFGTGEFSWGVNNGWSLYGGELYAQDYNALAIGIGRDLLAFGAISFDVTNSRAVLPAEDTKTGNSYRVSYSKRFDEYDSQVSFAGYKFSERGFMSMAEYLNARYHDGDSGDDKEMYTISLNKQFRDLNFSTYLNYNHQTYWNRPSTDTWNISVSNYFDIGSFKNINLSLSAYRTQYDDTNDDGVYVGLSMPWGESGTINYNSQFNGGESNHSVGYYNRIDANNNYRIDAGTTNHGEGTGSGYFTHDGDYTSMTANASFNGSDYQAFGMSMSGGMTVTGQGAALHRSTGSGSTRMLIDTDGVSDVPVQGSGGTIHSNAFGKAVVTDLSSYYRNTVRVDLDKLPENVDATRSVVEDTLTEGAIGYKKFGLLSGEKSMATIKLPDGSSPPFGAEVHNLKDIQTGIVGENGSVWLSGIKAGEEMAVYWDDKTQCLIELPTPLPPLTKGLLLPCKLVTTENKAK